MALRLIAAARPLALPALLLLASVLPAAASNAAPGASLSGIARLEAADRLDKGEIHSLFRDYLSLGLRVEAAALVERRVHVGELSREEAEPLFEEAVLAQSRWRNPENLIAICETAFRNEVRTDLLRYACGTGLRMAGRRAEASSLVAGIDPDNALNPYALYAQGQMAAERGDVDAALAIFGAVAQKSRGLPQGDALARRAADSRAELVLSRGRNAGPPPLLSSVAGREGDALRAAAGWIAGSDNGAGRGEPIGVQALELSGRQRILYYLLIGGVARDREQFDLAIESLSRGEDDLETLLALPGPPAETQGRAFEETEFIGRLIGSHRSARQALAAEGSAAKPEEVRFLLSELLVKLLVLDYARSRGGDVGSAPREGVAPPSSSHVGGVLRKIEEVVLGGVEVDRLVEEITRRVDTLQNLGHPIRRYRLLTRLEKSHTEIRLHRERLIAQRDAAARATGDAGPSRPAQPLREIGLFLEELDEIRLTAGEIRGLMRRDFNVLRATEGPEDIEAGTLRRLTEEVLSFDRDAMARLLPAVKVMEEKARSAAWERERQELLRLRAVIVRQRADALAAKALSVRTQAAGGQEQALRLLEEAASCLDGARLDLSDRAACAIHIGSILLAAPQRWEALPGRPPEARESGLAARVLPVLSAAVKSGIRPEEALYVMALLQWRTGEPAASSAARDFVARFSSSPLGGSIALRLGHEALLSGRDAEAVSHYRAAADGAGTEASLAGRYMLAWARFQRGDGEGAALELSAPLSAPSFPCADPAPFDRAVLSLAVRAWKESRLELLHDYGPVREGTCGGKLLLAALAAGEEDRGDPLRASTVSGEMARRFPQDPAALDYEVRSVDGLLRAGRDEEALPAALSLAGKCGGSAPGSASPPGRERACADLAGILKTLSEKNFEEGIRTGKRASLAAAAAGWERYFLLQQGRDSEEDQEQRLKWAVAELRAGERGKGLASLDRLAREGRPDGVGERAAVLLAETRIAGFEREEDGAEETEKAALAYLRRFPSEKAASLAVRAAADFLKSADHPRAARVAGEVEKSAAAPPPIVSEARLVRAEALLSRGDLPGARAEADAVLGEAGGRGAPGAGGRARNILLLAYLKEVEKWEAAGVWNEAAAFLEELAGKFPDSPETPRYYLRAVRSYRQGGDQGGMIRAGSAFLRRYPHRGESVEVTGMLGPALEARNESGNAAEVYAAAAERFPASDQAPLFLFRAACLSRDLGDAELARKRFLAYAAGYSNPRWRTAYATLSAGLLDWEKGETKAAIRELESGLRQMDVGVEEDAPAELTGLAGRARLAIGRHWADHFRKLKLVAPFEKNLALKDRYFRKSLAAFEKAESGGPAEVAVDASQLSGDLLVEFGRAILASQRPKGLKGEALAEYDQALAARSRAYFERALDRYAGALDRLDESEGPSDLAVPIRQRIEAVQNHLADPPGGNAP